MLKSALLSTIRCFILIGLLLGCARAAGIVICPEHGVRSGATGNKQVTFNNGKRHESCEYTHPLKDLSGSHKFWSDCQ